MPITGRGKSLREWLGRGRRRQGFAQLYADVYQESVASNAAWGDWFFDATPGGGSTPLTFGSAASTNAGGGSHTFTAMTVGTAASDRWVIAATYVSHNSSSSIASVTIGGVSATLLYGQPTITNFAGRWEFWKANVPTGTTADVALTMNSGSFFDAACATYYSNGEPTLYDTAVDTVFTGTTFDVAIDVPEGGAIIGLCSNDNFGTLTGWSGATADASNYTHWASEDQLSAETARAVSVTMSAAAGSTGFIGLTVIAVSLPTGAGAQTLTPALYSDADTFGAATITTGAVTLTPTIYTDADTFGAATVTRGAVALSPTLYSDGDTFGAATVTPGAVTLSPTLYADGDTFGTAVVSVGAVTLTTTLYEDPDTFGAATVSLGGVAQDLTLTLYADADSFGAAVITTGAVTLSPALYADGDTFGAAVITTGAVTITPTLYVDADAFGAAVITVGVVTLTPALYADPDTFGAAVITTGAVTLSATLYNDADAFGAATITTGAVTLSPSLYADADAFGSPTVALGAVTLLPALYVDADTFGAASVTVGAVTLSATLFVNPDTFGAAVIEQIGNAITVRIAGTWRAAVTVADFAPSAEAAVWRGEIGLIGRVRVGRSEGNWRGNSIAATWGQS